jgi:HAD superfamily phosphoserine phosphatase-like hydrolase
MAKWAVFDVDGTLFPSSSLEKEFISFMLRNGILPLENIFYYLLSGLLRAINQNFIDSFKSNKNYLKFISVKTIHQAGRKFIKRHIHSQISLIGLEKICFYRNHGYKVLIMSGSPDFLLNPLAGTFKQDYLICSEPEVKLNFYTGELHGLHPYGKRKTLLLKKLQKKLDIDFQKSAVFANHSSDIDHMLMFGKAVAINPAKKLLYFAKNRNWDIQNW